MDALVWRDVPRWDERWGVIGTVGEGNQGRAYVAQLADGSDPVARFLKVLKEQQATEKRRRLQREAAALAALRHPRIPRLVETNAHHQGEVERFELYLVTELVPGVTLDKLLRSAGPLALDPALDLAERLLDAVAHCHARDCLHRDIKPANIMLRDGDPGDPVLVDFFLAVSWRTAGPPISGWRDQRDPRLDLTQVARILFCCLTGEFNMPCRDWSGVPPHRRPDEYAALVAASGARARPLLELFDRGFEASLADRFQSGEEFQAALRRTREAEWAGRGRGPARAPVQAAGRTGRGGRMEVLAAAWDALDSCLHLAAERPGALAPDLDRAMHHLGTCLAALRKREEALAAVQDAGDPYRAAALADLSGRLARLGRYEEALSAAREAVALRRDLAARNPEAGTPDLAAALDGLGIALARQGRSEEALAAAEEAVAIRRGLAGQRPDAFAPELAISLAVLGSCRGAIGEHEGALAADGEAIATLREPFARRPDSFGPLMRRLVTQYRGRCRTLGRPPDDRLLGSASLDLGKSRGPDL